MFNLKFKFIIMEKKKLSHEEFSDSDAYPEIRSYLDRNKADAN